MKREKAWGGCTGSHCASQAEGADIIGERQTSRRGEAMKARVEDKKKWQEQKQLQMFFKKNP